MKRYNLVIFSTTLQPQLPIRGMEDAAGGVFSVKSSNSKKNATNMFIPVRDELRVIVNISYRYNR